MNYLEAFFQKVPADDMIRILHNEPSKTMFTSALNTILHTSSNQRITLLALSLLGRLGGRSRSLLRGDIDLPCYSSPSTGFEVVFRSLSSSVRHHLITMDSYIAEAVGLLYRNLIVESLDDTVAKLSQTLRCSPTNIEKIRRVRVQYKLRAIDMLEKCLVACCSCSAVDVDPSLCYALEMCLRRDEPHAMPPSDGEKAQERCVSLLLYGLLLACCDSEVKDEAIARVKSFLTYFACLMMSNTHFRKGDQDDIGILFNNASSYSEVLHNLSMGVISILSPLVVTFPPDSLSPLVLFNVIASLLDNEFPSVDDLVVDVSIHFWNVVEEQAKRKGSALWIALPCMESFLASLLHHCVKSGWRCRVGVRVLSDP